MATQLTFRRGTSEPTQASGLTLGEPAFNTALNTFHIGRGAGVTAAWVGARISSLSADIAAGLTMQVPTMSAVKDYVASTTSGVATLNSLTGAVTLAAGTNIGVTSASGSITVTNLGVQTFNGRTGAVQGVSAAAAGDGIAVSGATGAVTITNTGVTRAVAGTGISVSGATGSVTITNIGVQSFNGNTGAVTGASLGANTFTALNTFNAGISAAGGVTFAGDIAVNGGDITTTSATATVFNTTATTLSIGSAATSWTIGATSGTATIRIPKLVLGDSTNALAESKVITTPVSDTNNLFISPNGNLILAPGGDNVTEGTRTQVTITNAVDAGGTVTIAGGDLVLSTKTADDITNTPVNIIFEGATNNANDTTLTVVDPTANRTITLPDASGTVALTSQLMGAVNGSTAATNAVTSFNGLTGAVQGVSAAVAGTGISVSGATGAVTITNIGVQSFNGATGAVTGASLGANTFTGLNTFNAGITTSFIYASTGSTFGGRVDLIGILDVGGGVTLESTLDVAGVSRFTAGITTSTLNASGAIRANAGLTASTLDVSGTARTTGDVTVGATLTVNGNFQVYGTLTTVNRTDLNIDDKTITMGRTLASDALADGGGLSLSGTAARTWTWSNTRSAWESNQGVNVASSYGYAVNGTSVLTSSTLGSGVTTSSLQSLGTIGTGVWQATAIGATYGGTGLTSYTIGDVIYASGTSSLAKLGGVTAGYLLSANGTGTAPEYKQLLVKDGGGTSIATITSASGTLSAAIQYATASLKGVASFDNTNFTVSTGAVTITGVDGGTY